MNLFTVYVKLNMYILYRLGCKSSLRR